MAATFEEYVDEWNDLVTKIAALKEQLKPLTDAEMPMRKAIRDAVQAAMGGTYKEGMNNFVMSDGRKLKVNNTIKREIDVSQIATVREQYSLLNDRPVEFDDLLRVKYELAKVEWNKLGPEAKHLTSAMITAKPDTADVSLA